MSLLRGIIDNKARVISSLYAEIGKHEAFIRRAVLDNMEKVVTAAECFDLYGKVNSIPPSGMRDVADALVRRMAEIERRTALKINNQTQ